MQRADAGAIDALDGQFPAVFHDRTQRALEFLDRDARVHPGREQHVAGGTADHVDVRNLPHLTARPRKARVRGGRTGSYERGTVEARRRSRRARLRRRPEHAANAGDEPRGRDHRGERGRAEIVGGDGHDPRRCEDGRAPSWRSRERDLRRARAGPHALGRAACSGWPKRGPATLSSFRRTCRIKRSTRRPIRRSSACWCAAARIPWW